MFPVFLFAGVAISVSYNLQPGESIEIHVTGERLEIEELIFAENSRVTLRHELGTPPTVVIRRLGLCSGGSLEGTSVRLVFDDLFSADNSSGAFTFKGDVTVQSTNDLPMWITNMVLFGELCVLDLARYNKEAENVALLVTPRSARVMNKWNVTNIERHGKKMRVVLDDEFLAPELMPLLFYLVESVRPMALFNNKSTVWTVDDCEMVFESEMWTHRFKSCFSLKVVSGYISVKTEALPYETLRVIGDGGDLWQDFEAGDGEWVGNLSENVQRLSLIVGAKSEVVLDLNGFAGRGLSVDIMAMPGTGTHSVKMMYVEGVSEEKISDIYLEGVDFYLSGDRENIAPKFQKMVLGRNCRAENYQKKNVSLGNVGLIEYDPEFLLVVPDVMEWPNSAVVNVNPSAVRTDTLQYEFEFYSGDLVVKLGCDVVAKPSFPFKQLSCALYVDYAGTFGASSVTLNVSKVIVSAKFGAVTTLAPLTFVGKDIIVETPTSYLPFSFDSIRTLTINTNKDYVEIMGNVSVASNSYFNIPRSFPTTVIFWNTLAFGDFCEALLDNVWLHEQLVLGRRTQIQLKASTVRCDIYFQTKLQEKTPLIEVHRDTDFLPEAVFFDVKLDDSLVDASDNRTMRLITGEFDCEYVRSKERYAMVGAVGGFYTITGSCTINSDNTETYLLSPRYTVDSKPGLDNTTKALVAVTVSAVVVVTVVIVVVLVVRRRKKAAKNTEDHIMFE